MSETRIQIIGLLWEFFNRDHRKVSAWLRTDNLNFGGCKPIQLMENGKETRVWQFISSARSEDIS